MSWDFGLSDWLRSGSIHGGDRVRSGTLWSQHCAVASAHSQYINHPSGRGDEAVGSMSEVQGKIRAREIDLGPRGKWIAFQVTGLV